ncbi:hypothetical protein P691DRAFT_697651 [Macrolepiota fuliginosa MF-IS2]|uniref:Nucleic acid-binding protein n=1 Tax=Macrolepiota fuliginosa MF-IS2 TaxID=1400762 RepID=A0A9P5XIQ3_9AGAR|nr:hypothetical protein P691DRAFT_697651 [Macrolepiota fuliginosa MF-IS2]
MFSALRANLRPTSAARAFSTSRPAAADLAKLTLIGRVARDPETRLTKNEKEFLAYTVITTSSTNTNQGERQIVRTFHRVLCFDPSHIEFLRRLKKGSKVYVQADYTIKEPEQGADPTTPQGQRHIFLTHESIKVLSPPRVVPEPTESTETGSTESS